jgi:hypothetical protein
LSEAAAHAGERLNAGRYTYRAAHSPEKRCRIVLMVGTIRCPPIGGVADTTDIQEMVEDTTIHDTL